MKTLFCIALSVFALVLPAPAQTALTQTTTTAVMGINDTRFSVASATGIVAGTGLYVIEAGRMMGEYMTVRAISGTSITPNRLASKAAHPSGALVIIGPTPGTPQAALAFPTYNPGGYCVAANTLFTPWINILTGQQWLCSTVTLTWVPGWGNMTAAPQPVADYAMATGASVPPGPLFQGTGTNATTSFTVASMIGYTGGRFCIIPTAAFTTTTAGNIAIATTAVAGKTLCYDYDPAATKPFSASY